jgi:hypothetical protein
MSQATLTLHLTTETLRNLEQAAAVLGVSTGELAEVAIERQLAVVGAGLEGRLALGPADLDRDIRSFARNEAELEDPLRGRRGDSRE